MAVYEVGNFFWDAVYLLRLTRTVLQWSAPSELCELFLFCYNRPDAVTDMIL